MWSQTAKACGLEVNSLDMSSGGFDLGLDCCTSVPYSYREQGVQSLVSHMGDQIHVRTEGSQSKVRSCVKSVRCLQ